MSFEVSSSDSDFLSDSTLVLEPIVPLKIRVFKNSIFSFIFYFEKPGSDSGFSFLYILISEASSSDSDFLFGSNARVGTNCYVENSSSQKLDFLIHSFILKNSGSDSGFFPFVYYIFISEVPGSDSDFLLDPMLVLEPIVAYVENSSSQNSIFSFHFFYFEKPGSDSDFRFL